MKFYIPTDHVRTVEDPQRLQAIVQAEGLERDRKAILAMLGEYKVKFSFEEFDPAPDYEAKPRYVSGAYEMVVLVEDTGKHIVLQHLLVHRLFGFVLKHWRQDWLYEAPERPEFTSDQTWRLRPIDPDAARGTWTQCVYEVNDAPRYCGTGKWSYADGNPTWRSDAGWRPLPRREYSKRSDYNALGAVNIHRITPAGWEHEQDNRKVLRDGEREARTLVRERGVNTYKRITGYDFDPGYRYWKNAGDYWQRIRAEWRRNIDRNHGVYLKYPVDGTKMHFAMFLQSERSRLGWRVSDRSIRNLFETWVAAPGDGR